MGTAFRHASDNDLPTRCRLYLEQGPPPHMTDYIPDSLTEIIIAHGVQSRSLDPELAEIGGLILLESVDATKYPDPKILEYMQQGKNLVSEVLGGIA